MAETSTEEDRANHDCLAKRRPGEPMFILLGRDPDAHNIVRAWAERRLAAGGDPDHCRLAFETAERMRAYAADPANAPTTAPAADAYPALRGEGESWQDISTAPKGPVVGNPINEFLPERLGPLLLFSIPFRPVPSVTVGFWCPGNECWRHLDDDGVNDIAPTHWRPLPAPPAETDPSGAQTVQIPPMTAEQEAYVRAAVKPAPVDMNTVIGGPSGAQQSEEG